MGIYRLFFQISDINIGCHTTDINKIGLSIYFGLCLFPIRGVHEVPEPSHTSAAIRQLGEPHLLIWKNCSMLSPAGLAYYTCLRALLVFYMHGKLPVTLLRVYCTSVWLRLKSLAPVG